jgi:hypothetical protein
MTLNEIKALIESGETEHKNLDFKAAGALLDKEGNKLRLEISKDVSSFANSAGGKIIYGVEENPLRLDPFDPKRFSKERLEHALKQAARDLRRFHGAATAIERELYLDAYSWLMSDDCSWPFSFLNVCRLLNHEPIGLREEMLGELSLGMFGQSARRGSRALRRLSDSLKRRSATDQKSRAATPTNLLQTSY